MKTQILILFILSIIPMTSYAETPSTALKRLMEGNERYIKDALEHPNRSVERRESIVAKQEPFACILGCADSRVSPEILFDQGVGDLFVVRVAGNVIGPLELDSIEYSVIYLHAKVILVIGHENCGAVDAVVNNNTKDIEAVASLIEPSVAQARKTNPNAVLATAIKYNAKAMKEFLLRSPVLAKVIEKGDLEVYAAYYNLQTGKVELLK